jgi:nucleotide-binding universal stress UspA family protein
MSKPQVMVALCNVNSVESLMALASQLSRGMYADLAVLHVVELPLSTPLDAVDESLDESGKAVLAQARGMAGKFSQPVTTQLLRAREAGEAIVGTAREQKIDLLVIGHHKPHPHTLGEALLGGVVQYVAHHAPCRVIVQIPAPDQK